MNPRINEAISKMEAANKSGIEAKQLYFVGEKYLKNAPGIGCGSDDKRELWKVAYRLAPKITETTGFSSDYRNDMEYR